MRALQYVHSRTTANNRVHDKSFKALPDAPRCALFLVHATDIQFHDSCRGFQDKSLQSFSKASESINLFFSVYLLS